MSKDPACLSAESVRMKRPEKPEHPGEGRSRRVCKKGQTPLSTSPPVFVNPKSHNWTGPRGYPGGVGRASRRKAQALESRRPGPKPGSATHSLCHFGQVTSLLWVSAPVLNGAPMVLNRGPYLLLTTPGWCSGPGERTQSGTQHTYQKAANHHGGHPQPGVD